MNDNNKKLIWGSVFGAAIVREFYDRVALKGTGYAIDQMEGIIEEAEAVADIVIEKIKVTPKGLQL